jgi:chromosomal replication initiator protein
MQAIGNEITANDPKKVAIYLPATKLVDEIVQAIRGNKLNTLMRKFDDVDALLIDDIQFLAGKDKTQEIFHNIFNDFHMKKKQVIMSSDRPPKELIDIESRLRSRFALGLVADIQAPDFETRIAILEAKLEAKQETIDTEFLSLIAQHIKSNVRELEGALNILLTRKKLSGNETSADDVQACLQTLGYTPSSSRATVEEASLHNKKSDQSFDNIVEMVANYYALSVAELKSDCRKKEITTARQILMLIAKKYFKWTLEKIGEYFGGKNHATAIYAIGNIEKKLKTDETILHDYQIFMEWVEQ